MTKQQIHQIELDYNVQILYITKSGSNLYGTATPTSDTDYKGIFLPTKSDRLLGTDLDFISLDSNKSNQANTSDDIDFHLDSIHKFFKLLAKGETGAIDLLFSMWSTQPVYAEYFFTTWCKKNYLSLITSNPHAFVGYAISQSKRYNVRGERYNELVKFNKDLNTLKYASADPHDTRLLHFNFDLQGYKHIKYTIAPGPKRGGSQEDMQYIEVLGKKFVPTVTMEYLQERLQQMEDQFGNRARKASDNVDWKALSHALRVILEIKELLTDSFITFPLKDAQYLLEIKQGDWEVDSVVNHLETLIIEIDDLLLTTSLNKTVDQQLVNQFILNLYGEKQ